MPGNVQQSSSVGYAFLKHPKLASIAHPHQPHVASLTELPSGSAGEPQPVAGSKGGRREPSARWQDKAAPETAPLGLAEPAPGTKDERRALPNTPGVRSRNYPEAKERTDRATIRMRPGVKSSLLRQASLDDVSLSAVCDLGLEVYARQTIHEQEEEIFEPRMRSMMRREIRASDDRLVPFAVRAAMAAEHTRLIEADLYTRQLRSQGVPLPEIKEKLKGMYRLARANVLKKTPQLQTILAQWWQEVPDAEVSQEESESGGEEGAR